MLKFDISADRKYLRKSFLQYSFNAGKPHLLLYLEPAESEKMSYSQCKTNANNFLLFFQNVHFSTSNRSCI